MTAPTPWYAQYWIDWSACNWKSIMSQFHCDFMSDIVTTSYPLLHPDMHNTELTDQHATVYPDNRKPYNCIPNYAIAYPQFQAWKTYKKWCHDNCLSWRCDNLVPAHTPWKSIRHNVVLIWFVWQQDLLPFQML